MGPAAPEPATCSAKQTELTRTESVICAFDGWRACPDYQTDSHGIEAAASEVRIPECISAPLANAR
jgi:hypothetical protein